MNDTEQHPAFAVTPVRPEGFIEGVHFGMSDEAYDKIPAFNATGIKWIGVSLPDYWMRSWMNPKRDEPMNEEQTFAKMLGTAYHKRLLYGHAHFETLYAPSLAKDDYADALDTNDELKAALAAKGLKTSGKKEELINRLLEAEPTAKIWAVIKQGYEAQHEGKSFLPWRNMERIEIAAAMIERDPQLSKAFTGGAAEVTVCWICEKTGVPLKCKIDYLKAKAIVELKSFSNPYGKTIDRAIGSAIANNRYQIAFCLYMEGVIQIAQFVADGKVYGEADKTLLDALAEDHEKTYLMVWQSTGIAPVTRGKTFPVSSGFYYSAKLEIDEAKIIWRQCYEKFGPNELWVDTVPITELNDHDIPYYG